MKAPLLLSLAIIMGLSFFEAKEYSLLYAFVSGVVSNEIEDDSSTDSPQEKLGLQIDVIAFSASENKDKVSDIFGERSWKAVKRIGNYVIPLKSWDELNRGKLLSENLFQTTTCAGKRSFVSKHTFNFNIEGKVIKVNNTGLGGYYATDCSFSAATLKFLDESSSMLANIEEIYHNSFISENLANFDCTTKTNNDIYTYNILRTPDSVVYNLLKTTSNGKPVRENTSHRKNENKTIPEKEGKFYNIVILNGIPVQITNQLTYETNLDLGNKYYFNRVVSNSPDVKVIGYFIPKCAKRILI